MSTAPIDQQASRVAFGKAFTIWLRRNGWSQQTLHDWAKAADSPGPWNSQVSLACRGELDPKANFWVGLGLFNRAIADQDLAAVASRALRDRLTDSEPFLNAEGEPATAAQFFAMFIGEAPLPEELIAPEQRVWTDEEAQGISEMCREAFRRIATDLMLNPKEAWETLQPLCDGMSAKEINRFREVLAGWEDWTADEVNALSVPGELGKPAQALDRMGGGQVSSKCAAWDSHKSPA